MKTKLMGVVALAAAMFAGTLYAMDPMLTEKVDGLTWEYQIEGGKAHVYRVHDREWNDPAGAVTIPAKLGGKSVAVIGANVFSGCDDLTAVTIPATVTAIEAYAFNGCDALTSVKIPDSVTTIGEAAFGGCDLLSCVDFGKKVLSIGKDAFADCEELRSLVFRGNAPGTVGYDAFYEVPSECKVYVAKNAKGWPAGQWQEMDIVVGDCMAEVDVDYYYEKMKTLGTVTGGGEFAVGKKVTLKATPNKGNVFGGWYDFTSGSEQFLGYSQSLSYTVTGDHAAIYACFYTAEEDIKNLEVDADDYDSEDDGYVWIPTDSDYLHVYTDSEPKFTFKGLPAGVKYNAKKFALEGTAKTPGRYKVQVTATNKSVKKATEKSTAEFMISVPNFTDDAIKVKDIYPDEKGFVPGDFVIYYIPGADGCKVSGLPPGMKWAAKDTTATMPSKKKISVPANSVYGAPTKPGEYTVFFTKTTADKVKHTATATFKVGPFPKLTIEVEGNGSGTVSGGGEYAANANVKLTAKANSGSVFTGWFKEGLLLSQSPSYTYPMAVADITIVAKFATLEEDRANIKTTILGATEAEEDSEPVAPGATVEVEAICGVFNVWWIKVDALSQTTVKVSGLPSGLKFTTKEIPFIVELDGGVIPANSIYGVPSKPGDYPVQITVTTAGKTSVSYTLAIHVSSFPSNWAAGQFVGYIGSSDDDDDEEDGGGDDDAPDDDVSMAGIASLTVSANGKISGKCNAVDGKTWTLSASNFLYMLSDGEATALVAVLTCKSSGKTAYTRLVIYPGPMGVPVAMIEGELGEGAFFRTYWKDDWKSVGQMINKKTLKISGEDEDSGIKTTLTMTFSSDGSVKAVYDYNGYKATCSSTLILGAMPDEKDGSFPAQVFLCFPENKKAGSDPLLVPVGLMWNGSESEFKWMDPHDD